MDKLLEAYIELSRLYVETKIDLEKKIIELESKQNDIAREEVVKWFDISSDYVFVNEKHREEIISFCKGIK